MLRNAQPRFVSGSSLFVYIFGSNVIAIADKGAKLEHDGRPFQIVNSVLGEQNVPFFEAGGKGSYMICYFESGSKRF